MTQKQLNLVTDGYNQTTWGLLSLPTDYDPTKKYPIIISLHGTGEAGSTQADLTKLLNAGIPQQLNSGVWDGTALDPNGVKTEFIIWAPQTSGWNGSSYYMTQLAELIAQYPGIDADRVYVTGYSSGGYSTWCVVGDNYLTGDAPKVAAIVPISAAPVEGLSYGGGQEIIGSTNTTGINRADHIPDAAGLPMPVWCLCGTADSFYQNDLGYIAAINAKSPLIPPTTTWVPNDGHDTWNTWYKPTSRQTIAGKSVNVYEFMLHFTCSGNASVKAAGKVVDALASNAASSAGTGTGTTAPPPPPPAVQTATFSLTAPTGVSLKGTQVVIVLKDATGVTLSTVTNTL